MHINEKIQLLRQLLKENNVDYYYITMGDYHNSEFIHPFFKPIEFITGFTGSAGHVIISQEEAILWSDGRYYIQAQKQIEGTCIQFYQLNNPDYPTPLQYLENHLDGEKSVAFDGKVICARDGQYLDAISNHYVISKDFIGMLWNDRPQFPMDTIFIHDEKYAGRSIQEKLNDVLSEMNRLKANAHVITTVDDIAWLLNLRGFDAISNPVFLSYLLIDDNQITLYIHPEKLTEAVIQYLNTNNVKIKAYDDIYQDVHSLQGNVLIDCKNANYELVNRIQATIIDSDNPTELLKAIKNEIEIENLRQCHLMDSVALTKFIYWLKTNISKEYIDEYSAALKLKEFRKQIPEYLEVNYGCISAYNENAAMMHYQATATQKTVCHASGILLVDSGGQYLNGTTDYTRTIALGDVPQEWKIDFTTVLQSHANLSQAVFLEGCSGQTIDIIAREPIWKRNLDYQCGTGHGLGFALGIHEGPQGIRWYISPKRKENTPLKQGMVVTNEPGIYIKGSHGIRTENDMVVQKGIKNEYGQFLYFETLNFVPIDLDLIDTDYLDKSAIEWLNDYHKKTYEKLSPYLNEDEKIWLQKETRAIY